MAKKDKKRKAVARRGRASQHRKGRPAPVSRTTPAPELANTAPAGSQTSAQGRFVRDLLVRGEAQELTAEGKLPLAATHKVVKRKPGGTAEVQRVRFKTF